MRYGRFLSVLAIVLTLATFFLGVGLSTVSAEPFDPFKNSCTDSAGKSIDSPNCPKQPTENPLTGPDGTLMKITRVVAIIAGFSALIVIIVGGMRYMMANGDAQKAATARNAVIGALVGLFIIAISSLIIMFVISKAKT